MAWGSQLFSLLTEYTRNKSNCCTTQIAIYLDVKEWDHLSARGSIGRRKLYRGQPLGSQIKWYYRQYTSMTSAILRIPDVHMLHYSKLFACFYWISFSRRLSLNIQVKLEFHCGLQYWFWILFEILSTHELLL